MNRSTLPKTIDDVVKVLYVREHPGLWFCHPCVATLIEHDVELQKRAVNGSGKTFDETEGLCSRCGNLRTVIGFQPSE
jgi:hypothetical protein